MNKRRIISLFLALVMIMTGVIMLPVISVSAANPKTVTISGGTTVAKGQSIRLAATVSPADADQEVTWKSSDERIAKVSSKGKVTGIKAGTVKITATSKTDNSVKDSVKITVLAKAVRTIKISAPTTTLDLNGKKTVTLKAKASPSSALQEFTWKSNNEKVAQVSSKGKVTAASVGTAKITATARDGSKTEGSITITVVKGEPEPTHPLGNPKYYAVIVGNGSGYRHINKLSGIKNDVKGMKNALKGMTQDWKITVKENATVDQMKEAISTGFAGATRNDICFFFYSGHGDDSKGSTGGSLCGIECEAGDSTVGLFLPTDLRDCLIAATPGKVFVALNSCGSGSTIYHKDGADPANFTRGVINALSGVTIQETSKTGELLNTKKFAVLAAAKHGTTSLGVYVTQQSLNNTLYDHLNHIEPERSPYESGSAFTYAMVKTMGYNYPTSSYNGSMSGDTNADGKLTLKETFDGIKGVISNMKKIWKDFIIEYYGGGWDPSWDVFTQQTQVSGQDSLVLFIH